MRKFGRTRVCADFLKLCRMETGKRIERHGKEPAGVPEPKFTEKLKRHYGFCVAC
jgi:hypothetical protein